MSDSEEGSEEEKKGPNWPISVFVDQGKLYFRISHYNKAIECFSTVLERTPANAKILVWRSKSYSRLMEYDLAMRDVLDAIKLDPKSTEAICQKGELEYVIGDFEFAYLTFQRGFKKKPHCQKLRYGLQKCEEAILNAIGPDSNLKITEEDVEEVEKRMRRKRQDYFSSKNITKIHRARQSIVNLGSQKVKVLLEDVAKDKFFFEKLLKNKKRLTQSTDPPPDDTILNKVEEGLEFLKERQCFWQMEKPLHARKFPPCTLRVPLENFRKGDKIQDIDKMSVSDKARYYTNLATQHMNRERPEKCIRLCTKILDFLEPEDKSTLRNKPKLLAKVFQLMGWAYQDLNDLNSAIKYHTQQKDIAQNNSMHTAMLNSMINLGQDYALAENYEEAHTNLSDAFAMAESMEQRGHILKDICSCELSTNNLNSARDTGLRVVPMAKELQDKELEMEALVLLGDIEYQDETNLKAALSYHKQALDLAKDFGDLATQEKLEQSLKDIRQKIETE